MSKHIVHVLGSDDIIDFGSEYEALKAANHINVSNMAALSEKTAKQRKYYPKVFAYATTEEKLSEMSRKLSGALND